MSLWTGIDREQFPRSAGMVMGENTEAGTYVAGAGQQGSTGWMAYTGDQPSYFYDWGGFLGVDAVGAGSTAQVVQYPGPVPGYDPYPWAAGVSAGYGAGVEFSNASDRQQLEGPFQTVSFNLFCLLPVWDGRPDLDHFDHHRSGDTRHFR